MRGTQGETREKSLNQQEMVTHMLDPRNIKRYTIRIQQGTIHRVTGSSPRGGLEFFPLGASNPSGSSP